MKGKRLLIILASVAGGIVLLVALFAGAIAGILFYSIGQSEAARTARDYLRGNERLKRDVGPVRDFGSLVTGSLNAQGAEGDATLNLKVIGERRTVNATVTLSYSSGGKWRVTDASYTDERGARVDLMEKYEPPADVE